MNFLKRISILLCGFLAIMNLGLPTFAQEKENKMKLRVLVDNNTCFGANFQGEPGWSAYIECDGKKILFDAGETDIFIKNANKMGIDLCDLDYIVISHGHWDHTGGLKHLLEMYKTNRHKKPTLIAVENVFENKIKNDGVQIGCDTTLDQIKEFADVFLTNDRFNITENLIFLGQIQRKSDFESKTPIGKTIINGELVDDYLIDDSALVYKTNDGIVIITGCSHSGITNIVESAKKATDSDNIIDVIGGFHLFKHNALEIAKTKEYFKNQKIKVLHPCHCADLKSKIEIAEVAPVEEVGVGMEFVY